MFEKHNVPNDFKIKLIFEIEKKKPFFFKCMYIFMYAYTHLHTYVYSYL